MKKAILNFDGGCWPNPGPMIAGYVLRDAKGNEIRSDRIVCGQGTNNVAEYLGLINGLQAAVNAGVKELLIRGDSQIVIYRMNGKYHGKPKPHIVPLIKQARELADKMNCQWEWVRREFNAEADQLTQAELPLDELDAQHLADCAVA